jgi:hypothetical protein
VHGLGIEPRGLRRRPGRGRRRSRRRRGLRAEAAADRTEAVVERMAARMKVASRSRSTHKN